MDIHTPAAPAIPAAIGARIAGGYYAGIIRGIEGQPDEHLVLLDQLALGVTWSTAMAFAEAAEASLPTCREMALLQANLPEHFRHARFWSIEQSGSSQFAWLHSFRVGGWSAVLKTTAASARPVMRFPIASAEA